MGDKPFPSTWLIGQDYDPQEHLMMLKGKQYLDVQNRLLWFIRDQRALIAAGLATTTYTILTDVVEIDRERGWAMFRTYVRDVLGNEGTAYGTQSKAGFADYVEKAATKSTGRALLLVGYGTGMADELDEGDQVSDAPVERRASAAPTQSPTPTRPTPTPTPVPHAPPPGPMETSAAATGGQPIRHLHAPRSPQERMAALGYKGILYDEERNKVIGRKAQYTTNEMARWMEHIAKLEREAAERAATPLTQLTGGTRPN